MGARVQRCAHGNDVAREADLVAVITEAAPAVQQQRTIACSHENVNQAPAIASRRQLTVVPVIRIREEHVCTRSEIESQSARKSRAAHS